MPKYGVTIALVKESLKGNKIIFTSDLIDPTAAPYSVNDATITRLIEVAEAKVENRFSKLYVTPFIGFDSILAVDYPYALLPISTQRLVEEIILWQTTIDIYLYYNAIGGGVTQEILKSARQYYQTAENDIFNYKPGGVSTSTPLEGLKINAKMYQYRQGTPNIVGIPRAGAAAAAAMLNVGLQDMTQNVWWRNE